MSKSIIDQSIRKNNSNKLIYSAIGFLLFYYGLILVTSIFVILRYIPNETILSEFTELFYIISHYTLYPVLFIGLLLLVVSLTRMFKESDKGNLRLKRFRDLSIIPLIIKPLTINYIIIAAFSAWGDDAMAQLLWMGSDLVNHLLLLLPFFYLALQQLKKRKEREFLNNCRFFFPFVILATLIAWIIYYPTSLGLFFNSNYEDPLQFVMVLGNAALQFIVSGLGIGMIVEFAKKFEEFLKLNAK